MKKHYINVILGIVTVGFIVLSLCGCANEQKQESPIQPTQRLENDNIDTVLPTQSITVTSEPDSSLTDQQTELIEQTVIPTAKDYPKREERLLVKSGRLDREFNFNDQKDYSEKEKRIREGEIVALSSEEELYLMDSRIDIGRQTIRFNFVYREGYTLSVNSCTATENISATGNLYAARLSGKNGIDGIQLLVEVTQTTEVYEYHVFNYFIEGDNEYLQKTGILDGKPREINESTFTMWAPSDILSPFLYGYPQKYVLCSAGQLVGDNIYYGLGKVPEGYYSMGNIVKLKQDILLYDRDTLEITAKAEEGSYLMLCATDAERWIYVEDIETTLSGWIYMGWVDGSGNCIISGTDRMKVKEAFDNVTLQYGY